MSGQSIFALDKPSPINKSTYSSPPPVVLPTIGLDPEMGNQPPQVVGRVYADPENWAADKLRVLNEMEIVVNPKNGWINFGTVDPMGDSGFADNDAIRAKKLVYRKVGPKGV